MLLPRLTTIFAAFLGLAFAATSSLGMTGETEPPQNCPVTLPSETAFDSAPANRMGIASDGRVRTYGTKELWTLLPVDGIWRGLKPRQPGDFACSDASERRTANLLRCLASQASLFATQH